METNPLVSIVIPIYNGSNYMREAIDSALAQTYPNIEIIVVNDGSTDDTREIALSYGDKIRYFEKENGGVSTALNLGIREMRGEYFSWLSHDDVYKAEKIDRQMQSLRSGDYAEMAVYSNWDFLEMPERTITLGSRSAKKKMPCLSVQPGVKMLVFYGMIGCELLIPKSYFKRYGLFDEQLRCVQDTMKWFQMFAENDLIYLNESLVLSRRHPRQVSKTNPDMYKESASFWMYFVENLSQLALSKLGWNRYQMLSWALVYMMRDHYWSVADYCYNELLHMGEPHWCREYIYRVACKLMCQFANKDIYLYCAGVRGRRLARQLNLLEIRVSGFSDSDCRKWGTVIDGLRCISPKDIPSEACVVVTKDNPEDLCIQLMQNEQWKVMTYDDIETDLAGIPLQKRHLEMYKKIRWSK